MDLHNDFAKLSEEDLETYIFAATKELKLRQDSLKQNGISEILRIAASIGVEVKIISPRKRNERTLTNYLDPADPNNTWTGRGPIPRWLNAYLNKGLSIESFKSNK